MIIVWSLIHWKHSHQKFFFSCGNQLINMPLNKNFNKTIILLNITPLSSRLALLTASNKYNCNIPFNKNLIGAGSHQSILLSPCDNSLLWRLIQFFLKFWKYCYPSNIVKLLRNITKIFFSLNLWKKILSNFGFLITNY